MLGKLSKSRKKIKDSKQIQSKNKKSKGKLKEGGKKNPPKPSHQHSVNSLLIRPHNQSQCSLVSQPKKILPKRKTKNHESSMSLLSKPGIEK